MPANSIFLGARSLGLKSGGANGLTVNVWTTVFKDINNNDVSYLALWTPACIPISLNYLSVRDRYLVRVDTFDITAGIADPSIFTPRKECQNL